jgi:hypothetical protein
MQLKASRNLKVEREVVAKKEARKMERKEGRAENSREKLAENSSPRGKNEQVEAVSLN